MLLLLSLLLLFGFVLYSSYLFSLAVSSRVFGEVCCRGLCFGVSYTRLKYSPCKRCGGETIAEAAVSIKCCDLASLAFSRVISNP